METKPILFLRLLVSFQVKYANTIENQLFRRSANLSSTNWNTKLTGQMRANSVVDCASKCLHQKVKMDTCNAFAYNNDTTFCDLAKLDFLEDPESSEAPADFFISYDEVKLLKMTCRGGSHCCQGDSAWQCGEGDGDCNQDTDCSGRLICGHNNCMTGTSSWPARAGGLWDEKDDCCEIKCTEEHPCQEGEGDCALDSGCVNAGWQACSWGQGWCLNSHVFPPDKFPNNSLTTGYTDSSRCCYRLCNKLFLRCGLDQVGCLTDQDCSRGLFCNTQLDQPKCESICSPSTPCHHSSGYCSSDSDCYNPGWLKCGLGTCTDSTYFPLDVFPNNTLIAEPTFAEGGQYSQALLHGEVPQGYYATDNCCYRVCNKLYHICQNLEVGCLHREDCAPGLFCNTTLEQPRCEDINECEDNPYIDGQSNCTSNYVDCVNSVGSYMCLCRAGYWDHQPTVGCRELDECVDTHVGLNGPLVCGAYTTCVNKDTMGTLEARAGFQCHCLEGYDEQKDYKGCRDLNECEGENGGHNCDKPNSECSNTGGSFQCICKTYYTSGFYGGPTTDVGCLYVHSQQECHTGNTVVFAELERDKGYVQSWGWRSYTYTSMTYRAYENCGFKFQVHPNSYLTLNRHYYTQTESGYDFVYITPEGSGTQKISGYASNFPAMVTYGKGQDVEIRFTSDGRTHYRGWQFEWEISYGPE